MSSQALCELSDDDAHLESLSDQDAERPKPPLRKRSSSEQVPPLKPAQWRQKVSQTLGSVCGCARVRKGYVGRRNSCFKQFAGDLDELVTLVVKLQSLHKQDMDDEVGMFITTVRHKIFYCIITIINLFSSDMFSKVFNI